jgi:hypothetical protein
MAQPFRRLAYLGRRFITDRPDQLGQGGIVLIRPR